MINSEETLAAELHRRGWRLVVARTARQVIYVARSGPGRRGEVVLGTFERGASVNYAALLGKLINEGK